MKIPRNSSPFIVLLAVLINYVNCEPVRGGYEDSLQNIGGYGTPYGAGTDYGHVSSPLLKNHTP